MPPTPEPAALGEALAALPLLVEDVDCEVGTVALPSFGGVRPTSVVTLRGRRTMWGGRAHVRTVLYMGTLVATRDNPRITAFYERLWAAGKVKKVALTACMHKVLTILNAMLKHRTPWHAQEVQG